MITIEKLRVEGEQRALYISLFGVFILLFFLIGISLGLFIFLFIIIIVSVQMAKSRQLGNSVLITPKQFSEIFELCNDVALKLNMHMPKVYIYQDPTLNAYALSNINQEDNGIVVFHSALVEALSHDELKTVIAHEFAHIKCNHTRWGLITNLHGQYYIPILSDILNLITSYYSRKCETTSDRAGLIVVKNLEVSATTLIKLAIGKELYSQINVEEFIKQAEAMEDDDFSNVSELALSHPMILNRIKYLINFYNSQEFKNMTSYNSPSETYNRSSNQRRTTNYSREGNSRVKYPEGKKNY